MIHSRKWMRNPIVFSTIFCMTNSIGIGWDTYLQVVCPKNHAYLHLNGITNFQYTIKNAMSPWVFSRGQQVVHRNVYRNSISNTLNQNMHERIGSSFTNNSFSFLIFGRVKKEHHISGYTFFLLHIFYIFHLILFSFYILLLSRKEIKKNMIF